MKGKKIIVIVFILILAISAIYIINPELFSSIPGQSVAMTVTGVTAVNASGGTVTFVSNDAELSNIDFLANVTVGNQGNDKLTATILESALGGIDAPNQVDIDVTKINDYHLATINNQSQPIYRYNYATTSFFQPCPSGTTYSISSALGFGNYCITKEQRGVKGKFVSDLEYFNEVQTRAIISGQDYEYILPVFVDNRQNQTKELRNGAGQLFGTVRHLGQFSSNRTDPDLSDYVLIKGSQVNDWHVSDSENYDDYKSNSDNIDLALSELSTFGFRPDFRLSAFGFTDISCVYTGCEAYLQTILAKANNPSNTLLNTVDSVALNYQNNQTWEGSGNTAQYKIEPVNTVFKYPLLQYRLDAEALQISVEVGTPTNITLSPSELNLLVGGGNKTTQIGFRSSGGSGVYSARLQQCSNAQTTSVGSSGQVQANQNGTISMTITPTTTNTTNNQNCVVEVYNTDKPSLKGTATLKVSTTQSQNCDPSGGADSYDVRGNQIWKCKSDGSEYEFYQSCGSGVSYSTQGIPFCLTPQTCGNGVIDAGEACDGTNLGGKTCSTQNYDSGELSCSPTCQFDVSKCDGSPTCEVGQVPVISGNNVTCEECVDKPSDGIIIIGHQVVQKEEPIWWTFGLLKSTTTSCQDIYNIPLIVIALVGIFAFVLVGYGLLRGGKRR